jgi:hypothetical protein
MDNVIEFPKPKKPPSDEATFDSGLEAQAIADRLGYKGAFIVGFNDVNDFCLGTYGLEFQEQLEALGIANYYLHYTQYEIPTENNEEKR